MRSALNVALQGVMGSSGRGSVLLSWRMPVYHLEMVPSRFLFANSNVFFFSPAVLHGIQGILLV